MVALIPKKDGGLRPIMLFRALTRIVGKLLTRQVRAWMRSQDRSSFNTAEGKATLDATWRALVQQATQRAGRFAEALFGIRKAFEQVSRRRLLSVVLHHGAPLAPFASSQPSHEYPRRLVFQGRFCNHTCGALASFHAPRAVGKSTLPRRAPCGNFALLRPARPAWPASASPPR
jgi:hypothetical protein